MMRTLTVFIACSVDGYIAGPDDDLSFLKSVEMPSEDYGYSAFMETIDTIVMGRRTYDWVARNIGISHYENGEKDVYVITRAKRPDAGRTIFYNGDLANLIKKLKSAEGKGIYCDGGGEIIHDLLIHDLIDEFIVSVVPIMIGSGIRLFKDGRPQQMLDLVRSQAFASGLVQLHYKRKK